MKYQIIKVEEGSTEKWLEGGWEPFAAVGEYGSYPYLDTTAKKERIQLTNRTFVWLRKPTPERKER